MDALLRLLTRRWLWVLFIFLAIAFTSILCFSYVNTSWVNERTLAWMDAAQRKGLRMSMWKVCPIAAAQPYPMLRRFLERPVLNTWFHTIEQVQAFDSLPPCPVKLNIYVVPDADQAVKDAVSARQQKASP